MMEIRQSFLRRKVPSPQSCLHSTFATASVIPAVVNHYRLVFVFVTVVVHTDIPQMGGDSSLRD